MKELITIIIGLILFTSTIIGKEREVMPILPKGYIWVPKEEKKKVNKLPAKDPNRVYLGPEGTLFPKIKFPPVDGK